MVIVYLYYLAAAHRLEVYSLSSKCPAQSFVNCQVVVVVRSKKNIFLILRTLTGNEFCCCCCFCSLQEKTETTK